MDITLSGQVVIVTGATQGIGEAIARAAAGSGAAGLVVTGRDRERGAALAEDLSAGGCPALFVAAELAEVQQVRGIVAACEQRFGRVDGLVNAAGATDRGGLLDATPEIIDKLYAVNARAPFLLMQDAVKLMQRTGRAGTIVNIITMSSHGGQPFLTAYAASKAALAAMTRNAAHSLRYDRIRVNGLNIGWTDTPNEHVVQRQTMNAAADWLDRAEAGQPFGRLIKVEDVARFTVFLLSPSAGIMTGSIIDYDQNVIGAYG